MKDKLIDLLYKYKDSFEADKEPPFVMIVHEADIILKMEKSYPFMLRRETYPAITGAREAIEVHILDSMNLGALTEVEHNEQVKFITPVIMTCNNGK
ncbi:hypothetical protein O181_046260 [Austropuccinia psidii MF-1]|uniref:Uncharacterized protein n=1 Tax=Austropuccinia psidii MF-1 TaxID=1389203 RepID=A0A9Q3HM04_9BASI|nr:hypothetical protein [Austropuccinia psidii MF-1]